MSKFENAIYNTMRTVSTIVFPLITVPYISRVLGAESVGKVNFANSIVSYFALFASLGVSTYAVRECSKLKDNRDGLERLCSEIFSINIIAMVISYICLFFLLICSDKISQYRILIFILSINIAGGIVGTEWLNLAVGDFKYIASRTVIFQVISLALIFLFVRDINDYFVYAAILVISNSGAQTVNIFYRKRYCHIRFTVKPNFRRHFKPIILLFSLILAQTIQSNIDIVMLGFMRTENEVGMYSMSVRLYTTLERIVSAVAFVLIPEISALYAKRKFDQIGRLLSTTLNAITVCIPPMTIGLAMLSKEILTVVCGEEYVSAYLSLSLLAVAMFINLYGGSFLGNLILLPEGREGQFMAACCISAVFNIIMNCVFIPIWGMNGAALTTIASMIIVLVICAMKYDKRIKIKPDKKQNKPIIIGSLCIVFICYLCKTMLNSAFAILILSIAFGSAVYFIILCVSRNETLKIILKKLWERIQWKRL